MPVSPAIVDNVPWETVGPGLRRKVYFCDRLTLVWLEVTSTGTPPLTTHSHPHDQVTFVLEGRARVRVGDQEREIGPGGGYIVPSNVVHGLQPLTPRLLILDTFTPTREDFRPVAVSAPPAQACGPNAVKALVYQWFSQFDRNAPTEAFVSLFDPGWMMRLPDAQLRSESDFKRWYDAIRAQFPEVSHQVRDLEVTAGADGHYAVSLLVGWATRASSGAWREPQWFRQRWDVVDRQGIAAIHAISIEKANPPSH